MGTHLRAALASAVLVTGLAAVFAPVAPAAAATTYTWSGAAGDTRMSTPANWAGGVAPAPGQRVALVFPALACVSRATCDEVANDVPDLTATSVTVVQPGTSRPGPRVVYGGYSFSGEPLRLAGDLSLSEDPTFGPSVLPVVWDVPLRIGGGGSAWRLGGELQVRARVDGGALAVRTDGGSVSIESVRLGVDRLRIDGVDSQTADSLYGVRTDAPVVLTNTFVPLTDAELGSLRTRRAVLDLDSSGFGDRLEIRVAGDVRLDRRSTLQVGQVRGQHAKLVAGGTVRLAGARLTTSVDCSQTVVGRPFVFVKGAAVTGRLRDDRGRPLADGETFAPAYDFGCASGARLRIAYGPRTVTLEAVRARAGS